MRQLSILATSLLLVDCVSSPVPVAPAPSAPVVAPVSPPATVQPVRAASCSELSVAAKSAAQAQLEAERKKTPPGAPEGYGDALFAMPPLIGACFEDESGAFVITLQQARLQDGWPQIEARWALEHVDRDGQTARIVPTEREDNAAAAESYNWLTGYPGLMTAEVSGLTVNGKIAVFTRVHGTYHEGADFSRGRLFVFAGGAIVPHAPAASMNIERTFDSDADGIADLETYGPFDIEGEWCRSAFGRRLAGPLLLAHGLADGTYSMSDEVVAEHVKKQCPRSPAKIVVKGSEDDTGKSTFNVACQRLWGASTAAIEAQIRRECPPIPPERQCDEGVCSDHDKLREWAAVKPPLTLR